MEDLLLAGGLIRNRVDRREVIHLRSFGCIASAPTSSVSRTGGGRSNPSSPVWVYPSPSTPNVNRLIYFRAIPTGLCMGESQLTLAVPTGAALEGPTL